MRRTLPLLAVTLLALAGCSSDATSGPTSGTGPDALLARHGLAGLDAVEVVDRLERLDAEERPDDLMASVRVDELVLSDASGEVSLPLPDDLFYVSIAPYAATTHDCFFHSLTTCQGELAGEEVRVTLVDAASGDVLVDEDTVLEANGFAGFWLPRDVDAELTVELDGRSGRGVVSTSADDPTCLTTVRLA